MGNGLDVLGFLVLVFASGLGAIAGSWVVTRGRERWAAWRERRRWKRGRSIQRPWPGESPRKTGGSR